MSGASKSDSVSFDANGKRQTLRLTPSAWIELEDAGLGDVQTLASSLEAKPSFKTFLAVFAAAMRGGMKDQNISDESALEVADEIGSEAMIRYVGEVVTNAFPDAAKAKGKAGNAKMPEPAKA